MTAIIALVIGIPVLKLKGHYLAMATLGLGVIIAIVLDQEVAITGGPDGMPVGDLSLFGHAVSGNGAWYALVAVVLFVTVWLAQNLVHSPVGRALKAVHGSEIAAAAMGVDVFHYKVLVFVLSAVLASVAGSLFAHYSSFITPDEASFIHSIELVTMVVLGGMASIAGSLVGAVVLTVLPQMLADFHDYEMIVFGIILMGMMILMPKGLVPTLSEWLRGRRS
jgi:branched-chain amino acid transport system permease protein